MFIHYIFILLKFWVSIKCMKITVISYHSHITNTLSKCAQSLYALKILRSYGLQNKEVFAVFRATILSYMTYASPAWWRFATCEDKLRLESVVRRCKKWNYCDPKQPPLSDTIEKSEHRLWKSVMENLTVIFLHFIETQNLSNINI